MFIVDLIMRSSILVCFALLAACSTISPQSSPYQRYKIENGASGLYKADAEPEFLAAINARQLNDTVAPLDSPLKVIWAPMPEYPKELQARGVEGVVTVLFVIEGDGTVNSASVVGTPSAALVELSLGAIRLWKFEPPRRNGLPVTQRAQQTFRFKV